MKEYPLFRIFIPGYPTCQIGAGGLLGVVGCPAQSFQVRILIPGFPDCVIGAGGVLGFDCPLVPGGRITFVGFPSCIIG